MIRINFIHFFWYYSHKYPAAAFANLSFMTKSQHEYYCFVTTFAAFSTVVEYRNIKTEEWKYIPSRNLDSSYSWGPQISSRLRPTILAGVFMGFLVLSSQWWRCLTNVRNIFLHKHPPLRPCRPAEFGFVNQALSGVESFQVFRLCSHVALIEGSDVNSGNIL